VQVARFLVDTSAWARYPEPAIGARLDELAAAGAAASCGVVELDLLSTVRDAETYATVAFLRRASVPVLDVTDADIRRALEVQRLLVDQGQFGVPPAVLVVAAVAERHGVAILHANPYYDVVRRATGQPVERATPDIR
jgi:predicted nucleic acid-binding protein